MLLLNASHPLSIKLQNAAFCIEHRFTWQSSKGKVPALSIVSVWAQQNSPDFFSEKLGFDVRHNFIINALTHEVLS